MTTPTPDHPPGNSPRVHEPRRGSATPSRVPGERRLAHPPSDRYRQPAPQPEIANPAATPARGLVIGTVAALAGAAVITFVGGVLAVSSGLVVAAGVTAWTVALAVRFGAGGSLACPRRVRLAVGLALGAVIVGQLGLWAFARFEGGVLGPLDYLGEVFGPLVPLELLAAWAVAWATAR